VPWRVALALQADGWWLRSDNVWSKPNVMPESTTDRPTKAHEYVFLLAKSARYFYDQDAVREEHGGRSSGNVTRRHGRDVGVPGHQGGDRGRSAPWSADTSAGRNLRSVWEITTQPFKGAHFAVFPPKLAERCVLAGCPPEVCTVCGVPRARVVEKGDPVLQEDTWSASGAARYDDQQGGYVAAGGNSTLKHVVPRATVGWTDCGHGSFRAGVVLDPFMGSGTTALAARRHGRHAVGVELNPEYAALCARRLQQLSLLADGEAA
jgi:DNA modification methylase